MDPTPHRRPMTEHTKEAIANPFVPVGAGAE